MPEHGGVRGVEAINQTGAPGDVERVARVEEERRTDRDRPAVGDGSAGATDRAQLRPVCLQSGDARVDLAHLYAERLCLLERVEVFRGLGLGGRARRGDFTVRVGQRIGRLVGLGVGRLAGAEERRRGQRGAEHDDRRPRAASAATGNGCKRLPGAAEAVPSEYVAGRPRVAVVDRSRVVRPRRRAIDVLAPWPYEHALRSPQRKGSAKDRRTPCGHAGSSCSFAVSLWVRELCCSRTPAVVRRPRPRQESRRLPALPRASRPSGRTRPVSRTTTTSWLSWSRTSA